MTTPRCTGCRVPPEFCFCAALQRVETRTAVDIVMHFREAQAASSTAHLARITLPRVRVHVRGSIREVFDGDRVLLPDHEPFYLYPSTGSTELTEEWVRGRRDPRPVQLIVPDGSWTQAKKVYGREPRFRNLPCVRVVPRRSTYRLRRAPREGGLATYEAIACALAALEGAERAAPLFDNFDVMVEQNLKARGMMAYQRGTAGPGPRRAR
jgi:DTW domain-containing protein YfiP